MLEGTSGGLYSKLLLKAVTSEVRPGCSRVDLVEFGKPPRMVTAQALWTPVPMLDCPYWGKSFSFTFVEPVLC